MIDFAIYENLDSDKSFDHCYWLKMIRAPNYVYFEILSLSLLNSNNLIKVTVLYVNIITYIAAGTIVQRWNGFTI